MPQLIPFYFTNQTTNLFVILSLLIYTFTKYILPRFPRLYSSRINAENIN